jgi:polyphenol oxidase
LRPDAHQLWVARDETRIASNGNVALVAPLADRFNALMAFSLRSGGRSPGPLGPLNFSVTQGDSPENVGHNFSVLGKHLRIDPNRIATCRQIHGDSIHVVDSLPEAPPRADAILTTRPGVFPAVKTADCLPILLLDPVRGISAAVHAGWRGSVLRITRKVIRFIERRFHTNPADLVAAIGPAIGPCCYEVDDLVLIPFQGQIPNPERFIVVERVHDPAAGRTRESRRLDLVGVNRFELTSCGVPKDSIYSADLCTACHPELFFSHRRDGVAAGRHIAVAGFRP